MKVDVATFFFADTVKLSLSERTCGAVLCLILIASWCWLKSMTRSSSESHTQKSLLDAWSQNYEKRRKYADTTFEITGGDLADVSEGESFADWQWHWNKQRSKSPTLKVGLQIWSWAVYAVMMINGRITQVKAQSSAKKGRRFLPARYDKFPWITLCTAQKEFCVYCRYVYKLKLFTFCKKGDEAFSLKGFNNYKAVEKFRIHENSDSHTMEARLKCKSLNK